MYTQCPLCDTQYRISAAELKAALGKVRCAHCDSVFNALSHLTDTPPEIPTLTESVSAPAESVFAQTAGEPPALQVLETAEDPAALFYAEPYDEAGQAAEPDEEMPPPAAAGAAEALAADDHLEPVITEPSAARPGPMIPELIGAPARLMADEFARARTKPYRARGTLLWSSGILLLLALLVVQYTYAMRNDLARKPELRPLLERLCVVVDIIAPCTIPLRRDLKQIELHGQSILPHPRFRNTLLVSVALLNKAPFAQPYPALELTLADFNGALIARRRFQPADYLLPGVDIAQGMAPQGTAQIALEVVTPESAVSLDLTSWNFALFQGTSD